MAAKIGLDLKSFGSDVKSKKTRDAVNRDFLEGARLGVNGTPTFFINGRRYDGEHQFHTMAEAIQQAIDKAAKTSKVLKKTRTSTTKRKNR
jgi:predicted DsbA family dithiol-disulfide isomerase